MSGMCTYNSQTHSKLDPNVMKHQRITKNNDNKVVAECEAKKERKTTKKKQTKQEQLIKTF